MMRSCVLILLLILLSAVFSGSEISYASASEIKLRKRAEESGSRAAKLAYRIFGRYEKALITILIGNNLVNIGASAAATVLAVAWMGDRGAWLATAVMTVLIIIFGEITPKVIASKRPEKFAYAVAFPIRTLMILTAPVVWLVNAMLRGIGKLWRADRVDDIVTEEDLETIIDTAEEEDVVDEDTADLLRSALDFDDVCAYEIITHRMDMQALDIEDDEQRIRNAILRTRFSRLPVYRGTTDHIVGFLFVNQALKAMAAGDFELERVMIKPVFVHKTMPLDDVLDTMRRRKCHMVIVTDEYGGTMGLITMEDVLEQLVGDIWDEKDVIDEEFVELGDGSYEAAGEMRIDDLFEELDIEVKDFDSDNATLGGWATEMLGEYPHRGDSFDYRNMHITVTEVRNMRVYTLKIELKEKEEEDDEAGRA